MDEAGYVSTDRRSLPTIGCDEEIIMKKLSTIVYPAIVALPLAAAFSAHA